MVHQIADFLISARSSDNPYVPRRQWSSIFRHDNASSDRFAARLLDQFNPKSAPIRGPFLAPLHECNQDRIEVEPAFAQFVFIRAANRTGLASLNTCIGSERSLAAPVPHLGNLHYSSEW